MIGEKGELEVTAEDPNAAYAIMPGMEVSTHDGRRFIVTGVVGTYIGIRRSTWWRRLFYRVRGWFRRR